MAGQVNVRQVKMHTTSNVSSEWINTQITSTVLVICVFIHSLLTLEVVCILT